MDLRDEEKKIRKVLAEKTLQLEELAYLNEAADILRQNRSPEDTFAQLIFLIRKYSVFPSGVSVRIIYENRKYDSPDFEITATFITTEFQTLDGETGSITLYYSKDYLPEGEETEVVVHEDMILIEEIARKISPWLDRLKSRAVFDQDRNRETVSAVPEKKLTSRKLLQLFLDKHNSDRDIFHDLMPFKVKEILLVASLYDAFSIEGEGQFSDHILGEYHQLNLTSIPRITAVSSGEEAMERLKKKHFDLVIIMLGADKKTPIHLYRRIKKQWSYLPVFCC